MSQKTPLYEAHLAAGAKMVDYFGWDLPVHYGSQIDEHLFVREDSGVFDASHMTPVNVYGPDANKFLRHLLANDIDKLSAGKAQYSCLLNHDGGVIDDLIVYRLADDNYYRIVSNSTTRDKVLSWYQSQANQYAVQITAIKDYAILAIQGPKAIERTLKAMTAEQANAAEKLKNFYCAEVGQWFIARTGYTGEDGFEITLPAEDAIPFWDALLAQGVHPCGLGARDTLRLEAGMNLYGSDMDEKVSPLESHIGWTVAFKPESRDFIGRKALEDLKAKGIKRKLTGIVLLDRGVLRDHQKVIVDGIGEGEITSGAYSPILKKGIAMARVPVETEERCQVAVRDKLLSAQVVELPFVKNGQPTFKLLEE